MNYKIKNINLLLIVFLISNFFYKVSLSNEENIKTIIEGVNFPTHIEKNDFINKNSIFVLEHRPGKIIEIKNYASKPETNQNPILNIESLITENENWEQGLNGYTFSPNFKNDNYIFVSYNNKNNQIVLSKFKYDPKLKSAPLSSEVKILEINRFFDDQEDKPEHNCGTVAFNPIDNYLYFCIGDARLPDSSQNLDYFHGKMLRINPFKTSNKKKNYKTVNENPFAKIGGKPEILFMGLRNSWKFTFDKETGDIFIPDVGSEYIEELNIVKYDDFNKMLNFGWSCYEGSYKIFDKHYEDVKDSQEICNKNLNNKKINFVNPSLQYYHDSIIKTKFLYGNSIIGGVVYKNPNSIWHNHYFFGDLVSSNIWYLDIHKEKKIGINLIFGGDLGITSLNQIDNKILATSFTGNIFELILPEKKNIEKSIYNRPIIESKLPAIEIINENNQIVFTAGSKMYKILKKIRIYLNKFL